MARLTQIVVDCANPATLARFWADALDGFEVRAYDHDEIARLAAVGLTPDSDPTVLVDGPDLEICFQLDDVRRDGKASLHLDLSSANRAAEVARLVELGADIRQEFARHTWMVDIEGNDFCITDA